MPWIIFGIHLWQYLIIGGFGLILGFLAGLKWASRRRP
jgi:hypothetical protein